MKRITAFILTTVLSLAMVIPTFAAVEGPNVQSVDEIVAVLATNDAEGPTAFPASAEALVHWVGRDTVDTNTIIQAFAKLQETEKQVGQVLSSYIQGSIVADTVTSLTMNAPRYNNVVADGSLDKFKTKMSAVKPQTKPQTQTIYPGQTTLTVNPTVTDTLTQTSVHADATTEAHSILYNTEIKDSKDGYREVMKWIANEPSITNVQMMLTALHQKETISPIVIQNNDPNAPADQRVPITKFGPVLTSYLNGTLLPDVTNYHIVLYSGNPLYDLNTNPEYQNFVAKMQWLTTGVQPESLIQIDYSSIDTSKFKQLKDGTYFDPDYYADHNPDVTSAYKTRDAKVMLKHYRTYGRKEGRLPMDPKVAQAIKEGKIVIITPVAEEETTTETTSSSSDEKKESTEEKKSESTSDDKKTESTSSDAKKSETSSDENKSNTSSDEKKSDSSSSSSEETETKVIDGKTFTIIKTNGSGKNPTTIDELKEKNKELGNG